MKVITFLIWGLFWVIGGVGLMHLLKIEIGWKIIPLSVFYGVMGGLCSMYVVK